MIRTKALLPALLAALVLAPGLGEAQDKKEMTAQQQRMKACNARATDRQLKGEERREFMSSCLKGDAPDLTAQQSRMRTCNRQASERDLKGEERQAFMSRCLKA